MQDCFTVLVCSEYLLEYGNCDGPKWAEGLKKGIKEWLFLSLLERKWSKCEIYVKSYLHGTGVWGGESSVSAEQTPAQIK